MAVMKRFSIAGYSGSDFMQEVKKFNMKFRCTDCIHSIPPSNECSLEFPNDELLKIHHYISESGEFIFCKYFELE